MGSFAADEDDPVGLLERKHIRLLSPLPFKLVAMKAGHHQFRAGIARSRQDRGGTTRRQMSLMSPRVPPLLNLWQGRTQLLQQNWRYSLYLYRFSADGLPTHLHLCFQTH